MFFHNFQSAVLRIFSPTNSIIRLLGVVMAVLAAACLLSFVHSWVQLTPESQAVFEQKPSQREICRHYVLGMEPRLMKQLNAHGLPQEPCHVPLF